MEDFSIHETPNESKDKGESEKNKRNKFREIGRRVLRLFTKRKEVAPSFGHSFSTADIPTLEPVPIEEPREKEIPVDSIEGGEELIEGMEAYRTQKTEEIRSDRTQEAIERRLNESLTTVDDIDEAFESGDSRIKKRTIEFEGKKVVVYELSDNYPFRMLSTTINFKGPGSLGWDTGQRIIKNPSAWARTLEEAKASGEYGETIGTRAAGNVISLSYVNSRTNIDSRAMAGKNDMGQSCPPLIYGFSKIRPSSLLDIGDTDLTTDNMSGKRTNVSSNQIDAIESLESNPHGGHNEIRILRYDEAGNPLLPDYILTQDTYGITTGDADLNPEPINETNLRHAAYFGVPIIFIRRRSYNPQEGA